MAIEIVVFDGIALLECRLVLYVEIVETLPDSVNERTICVVLCVAIMRLCCKWDLSGTTATNEERHQDGNNRIRECVHSVGLCGRCVVP